MKVLFLCRANIGRSQMANVLYNKIIKEGSIGAGAKVKSEREGMVVGDVVGAVNMMPCMQEVGIDISGSKIKQVTPEMVSWADKIIVMTSKENLPEFVLDSGKVEFWKVEDPKGMDIEGHCKIRDQIKGLIEKMFVVIDGRVVCISGG